MKYRDNYREFLNRIPISIENANRNKKISVIGYTSDLDVLLTVETQKFSQLLARYKVTDIYYNQDETIATPQGFLRIAAYFMLNGSGQEIEISTQEVSDFIEANFVCSQAIGGTAAHCCLAIAQAGVDVIVHLTDRSKEVCEMIVNPRIKFVQDEDLVDVTQVISGNPPLPHYIVQYNQGDTITINGKVHVVPKSDRLILPYDEIHKELPIEQDFLDYLEANAENIRSYSVSGFNNIVDLARLKSVVDLVKPHYQKIKEQNPDCIIYLEGAHYLSFKVKEELLKAVGEVIDIFSVNEDELSIMAKQSGLNFDGCSAESVYESIEFIRNNYGLKGVVLHTKDYSMYQGLKIDNINIEKALTLGNLTSGTRARKGKYGDLNDFEETINQLKLSDIGLDFANKIAEIEVEDRNQIVAVPSRYLENPFTTIGLGDSFLAGMQIGFLEPSL